MPYSEFGKNVEKLINSAEKERRKYITERLIKIHEKIVKPNPFHYNSKMIIDKNGIYTETEDAILIWDCKGYKVISKHKIKNLRFKIRKKKVKIKKHKNYRRLQNLNFNNKYLKLFSLAKQFGL